MRLYSKPGLICLTLIAVAIPVVVWLVLPVVPAMTTTQNPQSGYRFPDSNLVFERQRIGDGPIGHPHITNVQVVDFDQDGYSDVIVCDADRNSVIWYRGTESGQWDEQVLARDLVAPAHATVIDMEQDGRFELLVSVLGNIEPDDAVIGRLVLLERDGEEIRQRTILDDVRRVADAQGADFDADGDMDLVVAVFGYDRGQVLWLENMNNGRFREHELLSAPGTIHVPIADFDSDGDPDIAAIVSQDEEELWAFENLGDGKFEPRLLYMTFNYDLGSAGLIQTDLDQDGDADLLLPAGDNLEDTDAYPQPYHGCLWLENLGGWKFEVRRIAEFGGTYAADVGDFDGDQDLDVVLASMANVWDGEGRASIVWLENDGRQNFQTWQIDHSPTHLVTVGCGDVNDDGRTDIVAGGLHITPPFDRLGRVTAWINKGASP